MRRAVVSITVCPPHELRDTWVASLTYDDGSFEEMFRYPTAVDAFMWAMKRYSELKEAS